MASAERREYDESGALLNWEDGVEIAIEPNKRST